MGKCSIYHFKKLLFLYRHAKMKLNWIKNGDGGGGKEKVCGSKKNNEDVDKLV